MGTRLRLLIVDDSEAEALRVVIELRGCGYEPTFERVETREVFLEALSREPWEIIIANHSLSQLDAFEVLQIRDQRELDLPVIVLSGSVDEETVVGLMKAGAQDFLRRGRLGRLGGAVARELEAAKARTVRRAAEHQRGEVEEGYRSLIEEIPALTYVAWADEIGATAYVSPQISAMLGFTPGEWLAQPERWSRQIHPEDRERVLGEYRRSWVDKAPFVAEYRMLTRDGHVRWWRDEGRVLLDEKGPPQVVRGFVLDITERKDAEQTIQYMTYHDTTTGLPNRTLLHERLQGMIERAGGSAEPVSLLIIALDQFREINNTLGHRNGDRIIKELAQRLGDLLGDPDRVARLRGDEFAMVVPGADARLGQQLAFKVQKTLEEPFMIDRLPIEVVAGVGVAVAPDHGNSAEALLRRADLAVQVAKREGRGCVVYSPECDPYDPQRVALMGELRRAIEANELVLHYQPKVDIRSQSVVGAEALVRWQHAKRGLLSPDHFVPLAEEGGLIKLLTHWVLRQALEQCQAWARERRSLSVAVNLSARNLHDPQLAEQISELLALREVAPQRLELEVTESAVMVDPVRAAAILGGLEQSGVTLAIDDFGTGYSSLAYLRSLPVSELKIDKSFVMGMGADGNGNATIVRSTSDLGHNLGLSVVAEGVEDQQTLDLLDSFGCDGAQGFHIGRPMPAAQLEQWLTDSPWRMSES